MEEAERRNVAAEIPADLSEMKEKADAAGLALLAYLVELALGEALDIRDTTG